MRNNRNPNLRLRDPCRKRQGVRQGARFSVERVPIQRLAPQPLKPRVSARARVESEGTLRAPRARSALLPRNRARHAVRRRAVEWENSVLKVKIDQNENFQITRHS